MWNLEGQHITGEYLGAYQVAGTVIHSRVKYGGGICHTVALDEPIVVFGATRDRVILDNSDINHVLQE